MSGKSQTVGPLEARASKVRGKMWRRHLALALSLPTAGWISCDSPSLSKSVTSSIGTPIPGNWTPTRTMCGSSREHEHFSQLTKEYCHESDA